MTKRNRNFTLSWDGRVSTSINLLSEIVPHDKYDDETVHNDIALIKLKTKIDFKKFKVIYFYLVLYINV